MNIEENISSKHVRHMIETSTTPSPEEPRGTQGGAEQEPTGEEPKPRGTPRKAGGRTTGTNCSTEVRTPKASFNRGKIEPLGGKMTRYYRRFSNL